MRSEAWLHRDDQFVPGQEIFRSPRRFALWAYSVSHRQLLLRACPRAGERRIDVLFKPVDALKLRADHDGLVIRCATTAEHAQVLAASGLTDRTLHVLMIDTPGEPDHVVTEAVGWRADDGLDNEPSALAVFPPGTDPGRVLPPRPGDEHPIVH